VSTRSRFQLANAAGAHLAVYDFRAFALLQLLGELPIDPLKIDQSFVGGSSRALGDRTIVTALNRLGRGMSSRVVAEGRGNARRDDRFSGTPMRWDAKALWKRGFAQGAELTQQACAAACFRKPGEEPR